MIFRGSGMLYDCLPTAGLVLSVGVLTLLSWRVTQALEDAHRVHVVKESVIAALVAEEAAFDSVPRFATSVDGELAPAVTAESPAGLTTRVEGIDQNDQRSMRITVEGRGGRSYAFHSDLLPGAAPQCMGNPLSIRHSVVAARPGLRDWLRGNLQIRLDPLEEDGIDTLLSGAVELQRAERMAIDDFKEDRSIGLLRLQAGTDRPDFKPTETRAGVWRPIVPKSGVRKLTGNLWIDRGDRPLQVELTRPLTVIVTGNIYLGRSLEIRGPGRLILIARRGADAAYVDLDGNGSWSEGDRRIATGRNPAEPYRGSVEGAGAIFVGIPGPQPARAVRIEASLVSTSEVYVHARLAVVHGALVVGEGLTRGPDAELHLSGSALPNIEREQLPGFRRSGALRPGMLTPID